MTKERIREICEAYGCELVYSTPGNPCIIHKWGSKIYQFSYVTFIGENTTEGELERKVASWCVKNAFG